MNLIENLTAEPGAYAPGKNRPRSDKGVTKIRPREADSSPWDRTQIGEQFPEGSQKRIALEEVMMEEGIIDRSPSTTSLHPGQTQE